MDWVYLVWLQAIDERLSTEEVLQLEGFSCSIRYKSNWDFVDDKMIIPSNQLYRMGYIGTEAMQYTLGTFDKLLEAD